MSDRKIVVLRPRRVLLATALAAWAMAAIFLSAPGAAVASKEVVAYFGTAAGSGQLGAEFEDPGDVAVNSTGAGPADAGDIYVIDRSNNRIQRFAQDSNGTPGDPFDDQFTFVSAWGADVDATPSGGSEYEICTETGDCQAALPASGAGALNGPTGLAIDQDTGQVYVADGGEGRNARINVYSGDGTFLRSFGFDVTASGPGNTGTGYEVCVAAAGDVCQGGSHGSGVGQLESALGIAVTPGDGNPATGSVYVADEGNRRVNVYGLDGSAPTSFGSADQFGGGSAPKNVAVDSRGIVYADDSENGQRILRYDSLNANGGGVGFLAPISAPPLLTKQGSQVRAGLEVDPDSDGPGPDSDVLYALRSMGGDPDTVVQQFGPLNAPGLTVPPTAVDDEHGSVAGLNFVGSIALGLDLANGRLFVSDLYNIGGPYNGGGAGSKHGVYVLDAAGGAATASLDSVSEVTSTSARVNGTVDPNGPPAVSYHAEYSTDGSEWSSTPDVVVGSQSDPQSVSTVIDPPGVPRGLEPNTLYHVRLVATRPFNPPVVTTELTFTTLPAPPLAPEVETTGSPVRTATTARLLARVNPRGAATTYHFEYGDQGPCASNPCSSTAPVSAGSSNLIQFAYADVSGLKPGTVYHYRVVADNGNPGSPSVGEDMELTTWASDSPLSHGPLAGPTGSDRAWEQVNLPDTGGNVVGGAAGFSSDGNRAVYSLLGGAAGSATGSLNQLYAERTPSGWQTVDIYPARNTLAGLNWDHPKGRDDLSSLVGINYSNTGGGIAMFRLAPGLPATKVFESPVADYGDFYDVSNDSSLAVMALEGAADPIYPGATGKNLYDVTSGTPGLLSLLPGDDLASCGISATPNAFALPLNFALRSERWVSADGRYVLFPSSGDACASPSELYVRDLDAEETELLSGPPLSGRTCGAGFIKSTPGAVFFWTQTRLAAEDVAIGTSCPDGSVDGDVYRYDLATGERDCVTCVVPEVPSNVGVALQNNGDQRTAVAVAADGSRVYFTADQPLLLGAPAPALYRVDVDSGDLAYVGPTGTPIGESRSVFLSPDGATLVFRSDSPSLDSLNGGDNGGSAQFYRYSDEDRSLVCVSCPLDGSPPRDAAVTSSTNLLSAPNMTQISDAGDFVFVTPTALVAADTNTAEPSEDPQAGTDVYEWRDGRLLLVTDGTTSWPGNTGEGGFPPTVDGITPDGKSVFFTEAARLTPDAIDAFPRLYSARIGGGFQFPPPPPPCSLEDCQGPASPIPADPESASSVNRGPGNPTPPRRKCRPGKRVKGKQKKPRKCRHKKAKQGHSKPKSTKKTRGAK